MRKNLMVITLATENHPHNSIDKRSFNKYVTEKFSILTPYPTM